MLVGPFGNGSQQLAAPTRISSAEQGLVAEPVTLVGPFSPYKGNPRGFGLMGTFIGTESPLGFRVDLRFLVAAC